MTNVINNYPLSKITTLEIGGPAKQYTVVKTEQELTETIKSAKKDGKEFLVIGGASNLLISDEGVDGLVIKNEVSGIEVSGHTLIVKSGTPLQELVDFANSHGLSGLQKLTGIPGTVGGAVYGNAGAYGQTISDHLVGVRVFDPNDSKIQQFNNLDCQFSYRDSGFKKSGLVILDITFELEGGDIKALESEAKEVLKKRLEKYKIGVKCPGSFFKNIIIETLPQEKQALIPKDRDYYGKVPSWYFLDEVGAKGDGLGDIKIADFHGNLFMNLGGGTAKDFYALAKKYYQLVKDKFGIELEPEVQLINLPPLS